MLLYCQSTYIITRRQSRPLFSRTQPHTLTLKIWCSTFNTTQHDSICHFEINVSVFFRQKKVQNNKQNCILQQHSDCNRNRFGIWTITILQLLQIVRNKIIMPAWSGKQKQTQISTTMEKYLYSLKNIQTGNLKQTRYSIELTPLVDDGLSKVTYIMRSWHFKGKEFVLTGLVLRHSGISKLDVVVVNRGIMSLDQGPKCPK